MAKKGNNTRQIIQYNGLLLAILLLAAVLAGCAGGAKSAGGASSPAPGSASLSATEGGAANGGQSGSTAPTLPAIHFSVDDVTDLFEDLTRNADVYQSLFENPMLAFLKELHQKYGTVSSLYCFYQNRAGDFDLSMCTDAFAAEFAANAHWLRLGFHSGGDYTYYAPMYDEGASAETAAEDYAKCVKELLRITGSAACLDNLPRVHCWLGTRQTIGAMQGQPHGITGLLAGWNTGDPNYYLSDTQQETLFANGFVRDEESGLAFVSTDIWVDALQDIAPALDALKAPEWERRGQMLVVFSHEYTMEGQYLAWIEECCRWGAENGYTPAFPEDVVEAGLLGAS